MGNKNKQSTVDFPYLQKYLIISVDRVSTFNSLS